LRIWPLYFLIIIIALLILPNIDALVLPGYGKDMIYKNLFLKIILYIFFLPNMVLSLLGIIPYASHTWSIGTEEQFYIVWPVILKFFRRHRLKLMIFIIFIYLTVKALIHLYYDFIPMNQVIKSFWSFFNIDCMAIGGFYAILLFMKSKHLKIFMNRPLFYFILVLVIVFLIKGITIPFINSEFYATLFGIIILNFASNDKINISLENKLFNYLGNISYGLYMYHPIGIALSLYLLLSLNCNTNWLLYPLSIVLTILIAAVSYRYFELIFLRYKKKFSNILTSVRES